MSAKVAIFISFSLRIWINSIREEREFIMCNPIFTTRYRWFWNYPTLEDNPAPCKDKAFRVTRIVSGNPKHTLRCSRDKGTKIMKNQREKGKSFKPENELKINFQAFPYSENKLSLAGKYIFTVEKFLFHCLETFVSISENSFFVWLQFILCLLLPKNKIWLKPSHTLRNHWGIYTHPPRSAA